MADYSRDDISVPKLSGMGLRALVRTLETPGVGAMVAEKLLTDSGLGRWRNNAADGASPIQLALPHPSEPVAPRPPAELLANALALTSPSGELETVGSYSAAYNDGYTTPEIVIRRLLAASESFGRDGEDLGIFIALRQAQATDEAALSSARWREGRALSPLDGVPIVVKDELDMAGMATTQGTSFRNTIASADAVVVARLRAAGAIVLGKANMNEIGINPIGLNPHHGPARNPWHRGHMTGGSSSGSAAAVAAGLCPISVGADGGGSIRIPAALCGVVGLKATFGRMPETGIPPLCWNVGHVGPLGLTVADVAAAYAVMAGPDPGDHVSLAQPPVDLQRLADDDLRGVRLGLCRAYFADAAPDVVARCDDAVRALTARGAVIVEIPAPDLNTILWTHTVIILSEMATAVAGDRNHLADFALDSRINLAFGRHFRATDLVHAMRHRHLLTRELLEQFRNVDLMITPTTASTAPAIPEKTLPYGESNLPVVDGLMRFVRAANLTGLPAISVPCGRDSSGLPVGVQLMGRPYEEVLLLRAARVIELATPRATPAHHTRALGTAR